MTQRPRLALLIALAILVALGFVWLRSRPETTGSDTSRFVEPRAAASVAEPVDDTPPHVDAGGASSALVTAKREPLQSNSAAVQRLHVLVIRADTRQPVADCEVQLAEPIDRTDRTPDHLFFDASRRTNSEGRAEFTPPAGKGLYLLGGENLRSVHRDGEADVGVASEAVEAFAPDEQRDVTLVLPVGGDRTWWARAVADSDRAPIPAARLLLRTAMHGSDEAQLTAVADSDGYLEAHCDSSRSFQFALEADGYAAVRGAVTEGHETRDKALVMPMKRAARLEVQVLESGAVPTRDVRVRLTTERFQISPNDEEASNVFGAWASEDPTWSAACDARGTCVIDALPPRVPLAVSIAREGRSEWKPKDRIVLLPGEVRPVTWDIGAGARLAVHVLDQHGAPVADRTIWLARRVLAGAPRPGQCYFYRGDQDDVVAARKTDEQGRCAFESVADGGWWIGPGQTDWTSMRQPKPDDVSSVGTFVEILPGGQDREIEVRVDRGLTIRGIVRDPAGNPVSAFLHARHASVFGMIDGGRYESPGEFVLGPLADGVHTIVALGQSEFLESEPVEARPGSELVILRLRNGATLRGTVFDRATGLPVPAMLLCAMVGEQRCTIRGSAPDGTFAIRGQASGRYDVCATTDDGKIGWARDVDVREGSEHAPLRIDVSPGAWVRVEYQGPADYANVLLRCDGVLVGGDGIARGARSKHLVSAGRVTVELTMPTAAEPKRETKELDAVLGETHDVLFDFR